MASEQKRDIMKPAQSIPFGRPQISDAEIDAVVSVLKSGMLVHGKTTTDFEAAFADRAGSKHAIAVSSCTAGLHLTLFAHEIGPGDLVAVPAMTHVATAHSVELTGAKPLFIDVDPTTGNMDPALLAEKTEPVRDNVKAIMPVHYLGLPCDMDAINQVANSANAFVLEDCALAPDATYGDKKAGTLGLAGSFSFYPVKHMTSIEGGMVTTDDDALAGMLRKKRAFSYNRALGERTAPGIYDIDGLGFNYRMSEVEAAVGLAQISRLDGFHAARQRNDAAIRSHLTDFDAVKLFPTQHGKATSSLYCLNIVLPKSGAISRPTLVTQLTEAGIGSSVHYPGAVPLFQYYREKYGYAPGDFPTAKWLGDQTISLPVGPHVSEYEAHYIGATVRRLIEETHV